MKVPAVMKITVANRAITRCHSRINRNDLTILQMTLFDLSHIQRRQRAETEILNGETRQQRSVHGSHLHGFQIVAQIVLRQMPHESARESVAGAGGIDGLGYRERR